MSAMMSDPNMMASMQSMLNSLTPAQMVDMAKQAGVNLNEQQASAASSLACAMGQPAASMVKA